MHTSQPEILAPVPKAGRFLTLGLAPGAEAVEALRQLSRLTVTEVTIVGVGDPLLRAAGCAVPGLRPFPALSGPGGAFPSTQGALWLSLGGDDQGELVHRARHLTQALGSAFRCDEDVPSFVYAGGRDLSGYEDGTENPKGERAAEVAILRHAGAELDGSSFVAVQRWVHDLDAFERLAPTERDRVIGRERTSNEELADAPESATADDAPELAAPVYPLARLPERLGAA